MGTKERTIHVIEALGMSDTLTEREDLLVDSVAKYFDDKGMVTEKQMDTLEAILRKDNCRL